MQSVRGCFQALRDRGERALIPFITAGDPDLETTEKALRALDRAGADLIELGVPYSDPLADGPTIQAAATRALQRGTRLEAVLEMVGGIAGELRSPIILFSYYNPILHCGAETFVERIAAKGVKGLVVPDLPLEEADALLALTAAADVALTLLVAPTSDRDRMAAIARASQGFIYLVSVTGVTGARAQMQDRVKDLLRSLQQIADKPVGVGFGISKPEQARQVVEWGADAAIVGSAFVKRLAAGTPAEGLAAIETFCQSLKEAIDLSRSV